MCLVLVGCWGNPAPHVTNNHSSQASWDGTQQNSGVISLWPVGAKGDKVLGFRVTSHFRERQVALVKLYGGRFMPAITADQGSTPFPDGTWLINQEAMSHFLVMNQWKRNGVTPVQ